GHHTTQPYSNTDLTSAVYAIFIASTLRPPLEVLMINPNILAAFLVIMSMCNSGLRSEDNPIPRSLIEKQASYVDNIHQVIEKYSKQEWAQMRSLRHPRCSIKRPRSGTQKLHRKTTVCQIASDTICVKFGEKMRMTHSVERLGEVNITGVNLHSISKSCDDKAFIQCK
ncbi:hypothetical protein J6590_107023, partial [Homalodisca vitripennis]